MEVGVLQLGMPTGVDIPKLCKRMNKTQTEYHFALTTEIENLGDPDKNDEYPFLTLVDRLKDIPTKRNFDLVIGITSHSIAKGYFSDVDPTARVIVVSLGDTGGFLREANREPSDYVALEIAANIATFEYALVAPQGFRIGECTPPWHRQTKGCLFDYCNTRDEIVAKLRYSRKNPIEEQCISLLQSKGVVQSRIDAVQALARDALRLKVSKTAAKALSNQILDFLLGGVIVGLFEIWIGEKYGPTVVLYVLIVVVCLFAVALFMVYRAIVNANRI